MGQMKEASLADIMQWALEIDSRATPDSLYHVVSGMVLRKAACDFSLSKKETADKIYKKLLEFQKELSLALADAILKKPLPPLGKLFRLLKKIKWIQSINIFLSLELIKYI